MRNYTIRQWTNSIDLWANAAGDGIQEATRMMLRDVQRALVTGSPVDTGLFRGNWQVTFNSAPLYAIPNRDRNGARTIAEADARINQLFRGGGGVMKVYFSNMLIYANALEYGHSKQAPAGVMGIVSLRLRSFMANAIKKTRK